jgi:hypothetical protein
MTLRELYTIEAMRALVAAIPPGRLPVERVDILYHYKPAIEGLVEAMLDCANGGKPQMGDQEVAAVLSERPGHGTLRMKVNDPAAGSGVDPFRPPTRMEQWEGVGMDAYYKRRIAELEAENAKLKQAHHVWAHKEAPDDNQG